MHLTYSNMNRLARQHCDSETPCLSIHMPTTGQPDKVRQDQTTLDNLASSLKGELAELGQEEAAQALEPLDKLLRDKPFWSSQQDGLAIFASTDTFEHYSVPMPLTPMAMAGSRPHLAPLFELDRGNGQFLVLALGKRNPRLLLCDRFNVDEITPEDMPASPEEVLRLDDPQPQQQFHTGTPGPGRRAAMHHGQGQGQGQDVSRGYVEEFCRQVDQAVQGVVQERNLPMVLVGLDRIGAIYREVSQLADRLIHRIAVNSEGLDGRELRDMALPVMKEHFDQRLRGDMERFMDLSATQRTTTEQEALLPAARDARVAALFLDPSRPRWGRMNPDGRSMERHEQRRPGDDDLLNLLAVETRNNGGRVHIVQADTMPDDSPAAALLRY